jgi:hypothetical protein
MDESAGRAIFIETMRIKLYKNLPIKFYMTVTGSIFGFSI